MISASSAFTTANESLVKHPIYVIEIGEYSRVFSGHDGVIHKFGTPSISSALRSSDAVLTIQPSGSKARIYDDTTTTIAVLNNDGTISRESTTLESSNAQFFVVDEEGYYWYPQNFLWCGAQYKLDPTTWAIIETIDANHHGFNDHGQFALPLGGGTTWVDSIGKWGARGYGPWAEIGIYDRVRNVAINSTAPGSGTGAFAPLYGGNALGTHPRALSPLIAVNGQLYCAVGQITSGDADYHHTGITRFTMTTPVLGGDGYWHMNDAVVDTFDLGIQGSGDFNGEMVYSPELNALLLSFGSVTKAWSLDSEDFIPALSGGFKLSSPSPVSGGYFATKGAIGTSDILLVNSTTLVIEAAESMTGLYGVSNAAGDAKLAWDATTFSVWFTTSANVLYRVIMGNTPSAGYGLTHTFYIALDNLPWLVSIEDQSTTISELEGGSDLGELAFTIQDHDHLILADFPSFVFEGKAVKLYAGFPGMNFADYVLFFTGVIDKVESVNSNMEFHFTCVDNKQNLSKVIYTVADDGLPTDSDHKRTLNGHPLDILLAILEIEVGYGVEEIDVATIEAYRDGIFAGRQFQFEIDSPPAAKDFIEQQIMKPLGGYLWVKNDGTLSVNFFYPANFTPVITVDRDDIVDIPDSQQLDLVNMVSFRFDKSTDGKFLAEDVEEYGTSTALYGQFGQQVIESDGMRSSLQGFLIAQETAQQIFLRYGLKRLKMDPLSLIWRACLLEPGDLIAVTHEFVPDRITGTIGIADKLFLVMDRTWNFTACTLDVTVMDASFLSRFGRFRYAPNGYGDYTSPSVDQTRYMFLCGDDDKYSNGDAGHTLG